MSGADKQKLDGLAQHTHPNATQSQPGFMSGADKQKLDGLNITLYAPLNSPALTGTPTAPTAAQGTNTTQIATTAFVRAEAAFAAPVGSVQYFALPSAPAGWIKANGAEVSRTTYAALFAAIGTTYGAGNGSTTFKLPDLRGEFIRGWDEGRGADPGRVFGSWQGDEFRSHNHGTPYNQHVVSNTSSGAVMMVGSNNTAWTSSAGGSETRPRNVALLPCIKY